MGLSKANTENHVVKNNGTSISIVHKVDSFENLIIGQDRRKFNAAAKLLMLHELAKKSAAKLVAPSELTFPAHKFAERFTCAQEWQKTQSQ